MESPDESPSPANDNNGDPCPPSFEKALEQLEHIVHQLEEGEIGLAEALDHYEKGIGLLKQCYGLLQRAERRIELLSGVDAAGNPITEPFTDDVPLSLDEKSQNRTRRRTKAGGKVATPDSAETAKSPQVRMDEPDGLF